MMIRWNKSLFYLVLSWMFLCFSIPTLFCKESGTNGNDKQHVFVAIALQFGKV